MTIQKYLYLGLFLVLLVTGGSSGYAIYGINQLAQLINDLYEKPFMANSFSQSAIIKFDQFINEARMYYAAYDENEEDEREEQYDLIEEYFEETVENLEVVLERATNPAAHDLIDSILAQFEEIDIEEYFNDELDTASVESNNATLKEAAGTINVALEQLVELTFEEGYLFSQEANSVSNTVFLTTIVLAVIITVTAMAIATLLGLVISRPILRFVDIMKRLSQGDLDCPVPKSHSSRELSYMANALVHFKSNALENKRLEEVQKTQASEAETDKRNALLSMAEVLEAKTLEAVGGVTKDANVAGTLLVSLSENSNVITETSTRVSNNAEQTLEATEKLNSAGKDLTSSTTEIRNQTSNSIAASNAAVAFVTESEKVINEVRNTAQEANEITKIIEDITSRITLLSLNAKIEAVRAGDAGLGFAVVAKEVGQLAKQTREATDVISDKISNMIQVSNSAVDKTQNIVKGIEEVGKSTVHIANLANSQFDAAEIVLSNIEDTKRNADETVEGMKQVRDAIQKAEGDIGSIEGIFGKLSGNIGSLNDTIIEVIRTYFAETNRRVHERTYTKYKCKLLANNQEYLAETIDVSATGVGLYVENSQALNVGDPCTLHVDCYSTPVQVRIVNVNDVRLGLEITDGSQIADALPQSAIAA